jgi:hypothetical protein
MSLDNFTEQFKTFNPLPEQPRLRNYVLRVDLLLLILAALGGVIFSASRTFTLIAEQSGSSIAAFAVLALEFSLAGLILSGTHKNQGWFTNFLRSSAKWITIVILLLILIVTNASYEIRQVGLAISEESLKIVLVFFLGMMIPVLVVINLENLSVTIPEYFDEFRQAKVEYYQQLAKWNEELEVAWKAEDNKTSVTPGIVCDKQTRRAAIQEQLERGESLNKSKLAETFGVSTTTILNDVKELKQNKADIESQF